MDLIIRFICTSEESLDLMSWIERVPSQSNLADVLSREITQTFMGRSRNEVEVAAMWRKCVDEVKTPSSQWGNGAMASRSETHPEIKTERVGACDRSRCEACESFSSFESVLCISKQPINIK